MDIATLLRVMWYSWHEVFGVTLSHAERSLVSRLRGFRNEWAHQGSFSGDNTYRALDSSHLRLTTVVIPQAAEIGLLKI